MGRSNSGIAVLILLTLAACGAPSDQSYCRSFGVEGTDEYAKCLDYYHAQSAAFAADREACDIEADLTYPPSLYDRGGYGRTHGGFSPHGGWHGGHTIRIEPDWRHNREVDRLRMRIIAPCMQAKGWNSAQDWQAGRHQSVGKKGRKKQKSADTLPWKQR